MATPLDGPDDRYLDSAWEVLGSVTHCHAMEADDG